MKKVIPIVNKYKIDEVVDRDDAKSVASSDLNSDIHEQELTDEQKDAIEDKRLAGKSALIAHRNELRDQILREVMDNVMPDAGAYDTDGMVKAKSRASDSKFRLFLKLVGCVDLDLHEAVLTGSEPHTRRAIDKITKGKRANPALINQYNEQGHTALIIAVMINKLKLVDLLIDNKALADVVDETTGRTLLMYSVINKNLEISHKLLKNGASANMSDFVCITPLMLASGNGDLKHVKLLCSKLAEVDDQDENGWTAMHYAVQGNAPLVIAFLLSEGADRSLRDVNRRRPLDFARFKDFGECIALLSSSATAIL